MAPNILNRVKELRTARAWTQEQLADAVGVSRQSINSIERNRYVPSLSLKQSDSGNCKDRGVSLVLIISLRIDICVNS